VLCAATNRAQAKVVLGYIRGLIQAQPMPEKLVVWGSHGGNRARKGLLRILLGSGLAAFHTRCQMDCYSGASVANSRFRALCEIATTAG
jgi:hypothetical protein